MESELLTSQQLLKLADAAGQSDDALRAAFLSATEAEMPVIWEMLKRWTAAQQAGSVAGETEALVRRSIPPEALLSEMDVKLGQAQHAGQAFRLKLQVGLARAGQGFAVMAVRACDQTAALAATRP